MARRLILLFNQKGERGRWGESGNETRERTALVARGIGCRVMWWRWELACGYSLITSTLSFLPLIFFLSMASPFSCFLSFFFNALFSPLYRIQAGLSLCICTFLKRIFKKHPSLPFSPISPSSSSCRFPIYSPGPSLFLISIGSSRKEPWPWQMTVNEPWSSVIWY